MFAKVTLFRASFKISDKNPATFTHDVERPMDVKLNVIKPLQIDFSRSPFRHTNDGREVATLIPTFAHQYIKSGLLKENRKILVVQAASGGTGFARHEWGLGSLLYERLISLTDFALNANKENRIVAFLWHQGEHDAFENAHLSPKERYEFYYKNFLEQMQDYRARYGNIPLVTGGFCDEWAELYRQQCDAVQNALIDCCKQLKNAKFVSAQGLLSNKGAGQNNDNIHFCKKSLYELGQRYFNAYSDILNL